jgi:flagellar protein FliS
MFGSNKGASSYAKVGLETGIAAASPHKLIVMLFEGALTAIRNASMHMKAGDIAKKGAAVSKAIAIVENGLRASLDPVGGGEIAVQLDSLYDYIVRRLMTANLKNDPAILDEAHALLLDLKGAWDAIGDKVAAPAPATQVSPRPVAYGDLSLRATSFANA